MSDFVAVVFDILKTREANLTVLEECFFGGGGGWKKGFVMNESCVSLELWSDIWVKF